MNATIISNYAHRFTHLHTGLMCTMRKIRMMKKFALVFWTSSTHNSSHIIATDSSTSLQWRHDGRDGVSNHQPHDCLLHLLFRRRSKKTSKFHVTGLCAGNSPVSSELPAQMASNAENVSIWWRHHVHGNALTQQPLSCDHCSVLCYKTRCIPIAHLSLYREMILFM